MKTYNIIYDDQQIARVFIDEAKSREIVKEMVEFWSGWKERLRNDRGSYIISWLKLLGSQILHSGAPRKDDEGWVPLDGSCGIKLVAWSRYEPDTDLIEIEEDDDS